MRRRRVARDPVRVARRLHGNARNCKLQLHSMDEISRALKEDRRFPPADAWRRDAIVNDPGVYARAAADPEAFWAGVRRASSNG